MALLSIESFSYNQNSIFAKAKEGALWKRKQSNLENFSPRKWKN